MTGQRASAGGACPCGSLKSSATCCLPLLRGNAEAPTAERLMRSRYTAFVRRDADYLLRTWHPSTRPSAVEGLETAWRGLDVMRVEAGGELDRDGVVEFLAHWDDGGRFSVHHEISRFVRVGGRWLYVDGTVLAPGR